VNTYSGRPCAVPAQTDRCSISQEVALALYIHPILNVANKPSQRRNSRLSHLCRLLQARDEDAQV
jgi:hypothetical protein